MPSALQLMAKSAQDAGLAVDGTVKSMLALQQKGGLISSKVLPHFAKNLRLAAQNNKALEKALNSNRVAMNQMVTGAQMAADAVFKSGWSEGLTVLFKSVGDLFKDNEHTFIAFGKIMGEVFKGLGWVVDEVLSPILSALGTVLDGLASAMETLGNWVSALLLPLLRVSPLFGTLLKYLGGFKGVFKFMAKAATRLLLPFYAILGVLEEIALFFKPDASKISLLGFSIEDIKPPSWLTDFMNWVGTSTESNNSAMQTNIQRNGRMPISKTKETPIIVYTDLVVGREKFGRAMAKSNAVKSEIASQVSESTSSNY